MIDSIKSDGGNRSQQQPQRRRAHRVLTRAAARSRSAVRTLASAAKRLTVFSYEAATHLTGLTFPQDQAAFLLVGCGVRNFVLVAPNKVYVATAGRVRIFAWSRQLAPDHNESTTLLRQMGRAASRGCTAASWRRLLKRFNDCS